MIELDKNNIPQHVAVIMDGNGRWAQKQQQRRIFGHQHALTAVRETVESAVELGVKYLTLYTFSTENWNRPKEEVDGLMNLLVKAIHDETPTLKKNNVKLAAIGDMSRLPEGARKRLEECIATTAENTATTLTLALSYSSRWEICEAVKKIVASGIEADKVDDQTIEDNLATSGYPDPDLLIRTGGELRVSNFMLWQMAYTEFYFCDILWPDFRKKDFQEAIYEFQQRKRRYGRV